MINLDIKMDVKIEEAKLMTDKLMNGYTLARGKPFSWSYDGEEIFISKKDKNMVEHTFIFTNTEIDGLIAYIKEKDVVPLANSVSKVPDGTEKDGIGKYIFNYQSI